MKSRLKEWIKRYVPAEIAGTTGALIAGLICMFAFDSPVITAYAGAWGENIGFYGYMILRDSRASKRMYHARGETYTMLSFGKTLGNIGIEFGFAEVLDSFIVRPFWMYVLPVAIHNVPLGLLLGKLAADVTFYIPVIISYELQKKHRK